jgi:asparagine N-glycosylation enzyme membrane subunit Stt3
MAFEVFLCFHFTPGFCGAVARKTTIDQKKKAKSMLYCSASFFFCLFVSFVFYRCCEGHRFFFFFPVAVAVFCAVLSLSYLVYLPSCAKERVKGGGNTLKLVAMCSLTGGV